MKPNRPDDTHNNMDSRAEDEGPGPRSPDGLAPETERSNLPDVTPNLIDRLDQEAARADGATGLALGRLRALARALGVSSDEPAGETDPRRED